MNRNLRRMLIAFVLSTACYMGTELWFRSGQESAGLNKRAPVAIVSRVLNEVQRKPTQRVIWENVSTNEELYPGEAIRTAPNADAQLLFPKTGTAVHLDPDSLIVLEQNENGLSLDFLQGNLFVQSSEKASSGGLTLKTGGSEIKLKSADLSLSKRQNGAVDLEVQKGEAELKQGSKTTSLNKEKSAELTDKGLHVSNDHVQILRPDPGQTLYLNLTKGEKIDLAWKALPAGYTVSVEEGRARGKLSVLEGAQAAGETGGLQLPAQPGRRYLRVVASSANPKLPPLASVVIPINVQPKSSPLLGKPADDEHVLLNSSDAKVQFTWESSTEYSSQVLQVSSDPHFAASAIKLSADLSGDADSTFAHLPDGHYYWRVTGFFAGKNKSKPEALASSIRNFTLASTWQVEPPRMVGPQPDQHISYADAQAEGVTLKWQPVDGVTRYQVRLRQKQGQDWKVLHEKDLEAHSIHLSDLKPGEYQWQVASFDERDHKMKTGNSSAFTIEEIPRLEWSNQASREEYIYRTPKPTLRASWKAPSVTPASYRYRLSKAGDEAIPGNWQSTAQTSFETAVPEDGKYQVVIEALNDKHEVIGQSEVKTFDVKALPLLPAPHWASNTPDVVKADGKGNLTLGWEQVNGAQNYLLILESLDGSVVRKQEIHRTTASINRLKPGQYKVSLQAVDGLKRAGASGEQRKIEVPLTSDIRAPKIKAMKVK